ncbi:hypothetical protein QUB77_24530 [Microcoleus sp. AT9b-C3]
MSQTTLYLWEHDICGGTAMPCPEPPGTIAQIPIRPRNPPQR